MKYQENIKAVASLQPDYLGFIFHEPSPRHFEDIIPEIPNAIKKVGVFVDEKIEFIAAQIEKYQLNTVQLHGNESPEFCRQIKRHYEECQFERSREQNDVVISSEEECHSEFISKSHNEILNQVQYDKKIEVIKVFSIKDQFDFSVLEPYEEVCDYFLFDTKGKLPGGNGYAFDWNVLNTYPSTKPFFLSGGIGLDAIENIKEFQKSYASKYCFAIDVNSKFEIEPGLKHINELSNFIKQLSF